MEFDPPAGTGLASSRWRAAFSEKELADLTFAIALMNAWNRVAVGFGQGPGERKRQAAE